MIIQLYNPFKASSEARSSIHPPSRRLHRGVLKTSTTVASNKVDKAPQTDVVLGFNRVSRRAFCGIVVVDQEISLGKTPIGIHPESHTCD
jgi:hypothetical protein